MNKRVAITGFLIVLIISLLWGENFIASISESAKRAYKSNDSITIAREACNELATEAEGQFCFTEFINRSALQAEDSDICNQLQDEADKEDCTREVIIKMIYESQKILNERICSQLQDDIAREICIKEVVLSNAGKARDKKLCSKFKDKTDREQCEIYAITHDALKSRDKKICNQLEDEGDKKLCIVETIKYEARESDSHGPCNQLQEETDRKSCIKDVIIRKAQTIMNQDLCNQLQEETDRKSCIKDVIIRKAQTIMNQDLCNQLQEETDRKSCAINVAVSKIQFQITQGRINSIESLVKQSADIDKNITVRNAIYEEAPVLRRELVYKKENVSVVKFEHYQRSVNNEKLFTKYEGDIFGMAKHNNFTGLEFVEPFSMGRGIASGDFNNDNWQDVVLATNNGIVLYKNTGGKFILQNISIPDIPTPDVFSVAFIDINNDGWQDIFFTTLGGENYFALSNEGNFDDTGRVIKIPNKEIFLTISASFADLNKDGYPDFILGNWVFPMSVPASRISVASNQLYINHKLDFEPLNLTGQPGDSLSTLFSDFNNDNITDLIVGNDFETPDIYYLGNEKGEFIPLHKTNTMVPITPRNTMSVDTADFNNDLYLDIFSTDMNLGPSEVENEYCDAIDNVQERVVCQQNMKVREIIRHRNIEGCLYLGSEEEKNNCMIAILRDESVAYKEREFCNKIPMPYESHRRYCLHFFKKAGDSNSEYPKHPIEKQEAQYIRQTEKNVMLVGSGEGVFKEQSSDLGVDKSFWSWNAKFADLDNDEWQDIYVGNGFHFDEIHSNIFYHNNGGDNFSIKQKEYGLEDFLNTSSYTYIDVDNDGDLDIIATGVNAPLRVYVNNEYKNNSITFEFRDNKGNYWGIGNKVYIYYGEDNVRHQVREIKSGGGFLSFDSPIAHFGLGKYEKVSKIEIVWSTGEKTVIDKKFLANKTYVITRHN